MFGLDAAETVAAEQGAIGLVAYSLLMGKTQHITDDINEVTVQVVNLVTNHRAQMQQPGGM